MVQHTSYISQMWIALWNTSSHVCHYCTDKKSTFNLYLYLKIINFVFTGVEATGRQDQILQCRGKASASSTPLPLPTPTPKKKKSGCSFFLDLLEMLVQLGLEESSACITTKGVVVDKVYFLAFSSTGRCRDYLLKFHAQYGSQKFTVTAFLHFKIFTYKWVLIWVFFGSSDMYAFLFLFLFLQHQDFLVSVLTLSGWRLFCINQSHIDYST